MAQDNPVEIDKKTVNGDAKAVDGDRKAAAIEVQEVERELGEFENVLETCMKAAREDPTNENLQALQDAAAALNEIDKEIDKLDTTGLEQRMKALSEPVAFTQTGNDAYSVDESLALEEELHDEELPVVVPATSASAALAADAKDESTQEAQPATTHDQIAPEVPAASATPQGDVTHEGEETKPVENSLVTAPKNDSAASAPTVVEGVNQTDGQNESQVTIVADPMPIYKLTPSVPQEAINVQQTPVSTFRSILVPILADLDKSHPTNYRVPVTVGDKHFLPILDTGSSLLWVPAKLTNSDSFPPTAKVYEAPKKRSSLPSRKITYGGDEIEYRAATEMCYVGDVGVESFRFGGATRKIFEDPKKKYLSEGILGISPSPPAVVRNGKVISDRANIIQCLEGRIFRTVLTLIGPKFNPKLADAVEARDDKQGRGFLAVGELSRDFFSGEMAWCPNLVPNQWVVELDRIVINGDDSDDTKPKMSQRRRTALIDTGTSYICAPEKDFEELKTLLEGHLLTTTSRFFSVPIGKLTEVAFVMGGRKFPLRADDMHLGPAKELATDAPYPEELVCSVVKKPGSSGGDDFMDYWVMGGIFMDNGVTSFAYSPFGAISSVGFADIPDTDLENWTGNVPDPWDNAYTGEYFKR